MISEDKKDLYMNRNIKLHPLYNALTWDVFFVWTIQTLFLSTQKGLPYSQIILLDSILMLFGCITTVPLNRIFKKVKPVLATQLATIGYGLFLLLIMLGTSYWVFILAQLFLAFGYTVNGIKANTILNLSLKNVQRGKDYQRIYGKGMSIYYVFQTIGAIAITFVFSWKPMACYIISLAIVVFTELYSLTFVDPTKFQEQNVNLQQGTTPTTNKHKSRLFSTFFVTLLLFIFFLRGVLSITGSAYKIYLQQLISHGTIPLKFFGFFYAGMMATSALSCKYQFKFDLKFGVKSLILFASCILISFVGTGIMYIISPFSILTLILITILSYIQHAVLMPSRIFVNNYLQVCSDEKNIEKAHSYRILAEYMGYALISFLYSTLLAVFNDNYGKTNLVYISILAIPLIVSLTLFIRSLIKKHTEKFTIIRSEYTDE